MELQANKTLNISVYMPHIHGLPYAYEQASSVCTVQKPITLEPL